MFYFELADIEVDVFNNKERQTEKKKKRKGKNDYHEIIHTLQWLESTSFPSFTRKSLVSKHSDRDKVRALNALFALSPHARCKLRVTSKTR